MTEGARRAALGLLLAVPVLLPFGRLAELPMLLAALVGLVWTLRGAIDLQAATTRLALALFLAYWLPQLVSAPDAVDAAKAWTEVALDLRYAPFLLFAVRTLETPAARAQAMLATGAIAALWLADAVLQAATGASLGGPAAADRLSGIFGADNLKLGAVLATLSPFLLLPALERSRVLAVAVAIALVVVVLLAGVRAAWITLALVLGLVLWRSVGGGRRGVLALLAATLVATLLAAAGYAGSERLRARIDRSVALTEGDAAGLDHALSYRLPIWHAAGSMIKAHPVNGVGVRGFRHAYLAHSQPEDRWRDWEGGQGAYHAHQWLLEVASETGGFGLLCWLTGIALAVRAWARAGPAVRAAAAPATLALVALLFPLNTHYAFYSSAWGGLLMLLLALWIPATASRENECVANA